jgi:hypothetical protein
VGNRSGGEKKISSARGSFAGYLNFYGWLR